MNSSVTDRGQDLRVLDGRFAVTHSPQENEPQPVTGALAVVHGPDGRTVIACSESVDAGWIAFWSGDHPHDPQATGMLSAIVAPLAEAGIPVMAASTYHADLVLVPVESTETAIRVLTEAGHRITR